MVSNGERAKKAAAKSAASRRRKAPLRVVIERDGRRETLECGHEITPRAGLFGGPAIAVRRRCLECLDLEQGEGQ